MPKNAENYYCEKCDFKCTKKSNYVSHQTTRKHQLLNNLEQKNAKKCQKCQIFYCKNCNKSYTARNSLWYHEKKCTNNYSEDNKDNKDNKDIEKEKTNEVKELTNIVLEVVKQNKELISYNAETQKQNHELTNKVYELCKNGTTNNTLFNNSNNKTFNLNFFLNETCKDAMNIMDFVDSIKLQLSDLEKVGEMGYIEGISNIIIRNLKNLDVTQRPIHCTDKKREVLYVKDENKWDKEDEENTKIRKFIKRVAFKNSSLLKSFREKYPDYRKSESKVSDKYNKLIIEAMGGKGNNDLEKEDKIIKNIVKEVIIEK